MVLFAMLLAVVCAAPIQNVRVPRQDERYPQVAMYMNNLQPLVDTVGVDHPDTAKVLRLAKWDLLTIEPVRSNLAEQQVAKMLRKQNARMRILAYSLTSSFFACSIRWHGLTPAAAGCDTSADHYNWSRWEAIRDGVRPRPSGVLWGRPSGVGFLYTCSFCNAQVDWSQPGIARALADTMVAWMNLNKGLYSGITADEACLDITFTQSAGDSIDFRRSGFNTYDEWNTAYKAGMKEYFRRVRSRLPKGSWITSNGCTFQDRENNGHMRENFPFQNGGTWDSNMFGWSVHGGLDVGVTGDDTAYAAPQLNFINKPCDNPGFCTYNSENCKRQRYILGSASLTKRCVAVFTGGASNEFAFYNPMWADEFSVDTLTGIADTTGAHKGWLGVHVGSRFQPVTGVWQQNYTNGAVIVNSTGSPIAVSGLTGYSRINGVVCPSVNNGASLDGGYTLPGDDALFMWKRP